MKEKNIVEWIHDDDDDDNNLMLAKDEGEEKVEENWRFIAHYNNKTSVLLNIFILR